MNATYTSIGSELEATGVCSVDKEGKLCPAGKQAVSFLALLTRAAVGNAPPLSCSISSSVRWMWFRGPVSRERRFSSKLLG